MDDFKPVKSFLDDSSEKLNGFEENVRKNYRGKQDILQLGLVTLGTGAALYAAVDQYKEGNSEVADAFGHMGAGMASSLTTEIGYRLSGLEEKYGKKPKYGAMLATGSLTGAGIELSQPEIIAGNTELGGYMQTSIGGVLGTAKEGLNDIQRKL
jgi:hypothetical protein